MGSKDATFLAKLKTAWDKYLKKKPQLICILSGSMSSWIEENILSSTGFFGRISLDLTIEELPLIECNHFWHPYEDKIAPFEKFKILSVTGGVPRYLAEIDPKVPADEMIRRMCFRKEGLLFQEFKINPHQRSYRSGPQKLLLYPYHRFLKLAAETEHLVTQLVP